MLTMDATASPLLEEILGGAFELRSLLADHLEIEQGQDAFVWRVVPERLDTLTPAQEALIPLVRDHWLRVGLSTARADRHAAECAMRDAYRHAKMAVPRMVWCESPFQGAVEANQITTPVNNSVVTQLLGQVRNLVRERTWEQVRVRVRIRIRALVQKQVRRQVLGQVWKQVSPSTRWYSGYGNQNADWLSFYAMFGVLGLDVSPLVPHLRLAHHCGWWWPFHDRAILTEKPTEIAWRDEQCVGVWYVDGWGFGEHAC